MTVRIKSSGVERDVSTSRIDVVGDNVVLDGETLDMRKYPSGAVVEVRYEKTRGE